MLLGVSGLAVLHDRVVWAVLHNHEEDGSVATEMQDRFLP